MHIDRSAFYALRALSRKNQGFSIGHDPTSGPGQEVSIMSRVESGRARKPHGSGRAGPGGGFKVPRVRLGHVGSGRPDPTRPATSDLTREMPGKNQRGNASEGV